MYCKTRKAANPDILGAGTIKCVIKNELLIDCENSCPLLVIKILLLTYFFVKLELFVTT